MKKNYDYLIVGAGLFGATAAHELHKRGYKVLVVEKRKNVAGAIYTEEVEGIQVHKYGPHIFHTSNKATWDYTMPVKIMPPKKPSQVFLGEILSFILCLPKKTPTK